MLEEDTAHPFVKAYITAFVVFSVGFHLGAIVLKSHHARLYYPYCIRLYLTTLSVKRLRNSIQSGHSRSFGTQYRVEIVAYFVEEVDIFDC